MSLTITVPAAVPSLLHRSLDQPTTAEKKRVLPMPTRSSGAEPAYEPATMSLTIHAVPLPLWTVPSPACEA